jgi:hypothetical protein
MGVSEYSRLRQHLTHLKIVIVEYNLITSGINAVAGLRDIGPQLRLLQLCCNIPERGIKF